MQTLPSSGPSGNCSKRKRSTNGAEVMRNKYIYIFFFDRIEKREDIRDHTHTLKKKKQKAKVREYEE